MLKTTHGGLRFIRNVRVVCQVCVATPYTAAVIFWGGV